MKQVQVRSDMTESQLVNAWIEEAVAKARLEGRRDILLGILRHRFPALLSAESLGTINAQHSPDILHDWIDAAVIAVSPDEFLAVLRRKRQPRPGTRALCQTGARGVVVVWPCSRRNSWCRRWW